jgi:hypothetical protein
MQRMTIREWMIQVRADRPETQAEDYRLYVIRDPDQVDLFSADGTVFYVGQFENPYNRLMVHMGLLWPGPSHVGTFIRENAPASGSWLFEQYTLEECSGIVGKCHDVDEAEEALIKLYHPCLNTAANPDPAPLPVHYKSSYREAKNAHAGALSKLFNIK